MMNIDFNVIGIMACMIIGVICLWHDNNGNFKK